MCIEMCLPFSMWWNNLNALFPVCLFVCSFSRVSFSLDLIHHVYSYTSFDNSDGCLLDYARLEGVVKKMNSSFKDNFQHSLLRSLKITFQ